MCMCSQEKQLEPYRQVNSKRKHANEYLKQQFGDLQYRTEEELDAAISKLDYQMVHEGVDKKEERVLFGQITKLQVRCCAVNPHLPNGDPSHE